MALERLNVWVATTIREENYKAVNVLAYKDTMNFIKYARVYIILLLACYYTCLTCVN